ncbi:uncharacterized protein LOC131696318 [Topomyia yanbarensis]|uniref:uncharacterized protein LOC131696318 n=1 Tax=Topomyia yanbarensis TaxID=2498891 RepID=UPI00273CAA7A|nr:uncharacterized protein LOC131696318 [Topomyia yanbarensis]
MAAEPGKVWYFPVNVVINPKKPGKVRLVWDAAASVQVCHRYAAASVQGKSLNSELIKSPDLISSLPSVLCPFRERPIAFGGDIAEMYHQLQIRPNDRSAQRFLFRPTQSGPPVIYVMDVATFGSTSSPCSAQYIKNRNAQDLADQFPDAVDAIVGRHYVDDYLDSTFTVGEAIKRASEVTFIHSKAGFKLRSWVSNSSKFLQHFGEQTESRKIYFGCDKSNYTERVLGMSWDTIEDVFVFASVLRDDLQSFLMEGKLPTKRILLRISLKKDRKIIIHDLWRNGSPWDEILDENTAKKWFKWIALLPKVQAMKIPRCYFLGTKPSDYKNLELHVFADASEEAYGSVAYFRIWVNGEPRVALVSAKSKVAPLQYMSIPTMELLAAVLAARLSVAVRANHSVKVKRLVIHIDTWIHSDHRKYKQFVAYRIGEILSLTNPVEWCWVASMNNIADVLTKWGKNGPPLNTDSEWVQGPAILYRSIEECFQKGLPAPDVKEEMRAYLLFHEIYFVQCLVDTTRFSRWNILIRSVASVFRFISNCRRKIKKLPIESVQTTLTQGSLLKCAVSSIKAPLKCEEYRQAENYLWKIVQQEGFADEMKTLWENRELPRNKWHVIERSSPLYKLFPF